MHLQVSVHVQPNQKTTMQVHPTVFCPISFPLNVLNVQFVPLCVRPTDTGPYSALFHVCFANPVHPVSGTRSPVTTHSELSSQDRSWQGSFILQRVKSPTRLNYLPLCFLGSGAPLKWMFGLFWKETLKMLGGGRAPKKEATQQLLFMSPVPGQGPLIKSRSH